MIDFKSNYSFNILLRLIVVSVILTVLISYNIDSQIWSFHTFPNEFKRWHSYIDANEDEFTIAGDDDGNVSWAFAVTVDNTPHKLTFSTGERMHGA